MCSVTRADHAGGRGTVLPDRLCRGWTGGAYAECVSSEECRDTLPLLISIHGGGWFYGDKELYCFYCAHMAQLGFVVVDCDYRLAPEYSYPAAIEDVCRVVRWSLENREKFTRNKHWFMVGDSAGAQLVSQYCILAGNPAYREQLDFCTYDQLPDGVALNCGIYDMSMDNDHIGNYTHETPAAQKNCWNRCWIT
ncbi:MAG: alpha/beta hydrolase [Ruminococcus callidus]